MKSIKEMTNNEIVENNLSAGTDAYIELDLSDDEDMVRVIELGKQFDLGREMTNDLAPQKLSWM